MRYWRKTLDGDGARRRYQVRVDKERCKACRFCIEFCPRQVFRDCEGLNLKGYRPVTADEINDCINCGYCECICPEFAIKVTPAEVETVHG